MVESRSCVQREGVYRWFSSLSSAQRAEFLCGLLDLCVPIELRFLGSCLEDLARKDYHSLRDAEIKANNPADLSGLTNITDEVVRSKLLVSLALLGSDNREAAGVLYRTLTHTDTVINNYGLALNDGRTEEQFLLLFTMASNHPAFSFHQKQVLRQQLSQIQDILQLSQAFPDEGVEKFLPQSVDLDDLGCMLQYRGANSQSGAQSQSLHLSHSQPTSHSHSQSLSYSQSRSQTHTQPPSQSQPNNPEQNGILDWLRKLRLHKYYPVFKQLTMEEFLALTEEDLNKYDLTQGAKKKLKTQLELQCSGIARVTPSSHMGPSAHSELRVEVDAVPHHHPVSTDSSSSSGYSSSSCSPRTPLCCDSAFDRSRDIHRGVRLENLFPGLNMDGSSVLQDSVVCRGLAGGAVGLMVETSSALTSTSNSLHHVSHPPLHFHLSSSSSPSPSGYYTHPPTSSTSSSFSCFSSSCPSTKSGSQSGSSGGGGGFVSMATASSVPVAAVPGNTYYPPQPTSSPSPSPSSVSSLDQSSGHTTSVCVCSSCGCRGNCGTYGALPGYAAAGYLQPFSAGPSLFTLGPLLHLSPLLASSSGAGSGTTPFSYPMMMPPPLYRHSPVSHDQQQGFGFYQPHGSMGNGGQKRVAGSMSCYNCGANGHRAEDCKQPPMDSAQQTFRLKYTPHSDSKDSGD
uniref:Zinc finger, CCHC domain containing 14 n=1 Tax=Seriola lalandi dorsalis TaxID=1841481 RepID=A0A3B4XK43_SERLL